MLLVELAVGCGDGDDEAINIGHDRSPARIVGRAQSRARDRRASAVMPIYLVVDQPGSKSTRQPQREARADQR
jgi:hypothetical protein